MLPVLALGVPKTLRGSNLGTYYLKSFEGESAVLINLISWCVFGLIAGAVARLLAPGPDRLGCLGTIGVGVLGSVVGGYLGGLIAGNPMNEVQPAGFLGSIIGGVIVLLVFRAVRRPPM